VAPSDGLFDAPGVQRELFRAVTALFDSIEAISEAEKPEANHSESEHYGEKGQHVYLQF
jgi:hypothetical protein